MYSSDDEHFPRRGRSASIRSDDDVPDATGIPDDSHATPPTLPIPIAQQPPQEYALKLKKN